MTVSALGFLAAILTTVCWVPQAWRTIRSRDTRSISLWSQALLACGLTCWAVYGFAIGSAPLIAANLATLALVLVILTIKIRNLRASEGAQPPSGG